jgi:hypothetical protein
MPDTPSPFVPASTLPDLLLHPDGSPWCGPIVGPRGLHGVLTAGTLAPYPGTPYRVAWDDGACFDEPEGIRLDTRRPEVRDQGARVIARWLGVPVGATAPRIAWDGKIGGWVLYADDGEAWLVLYTSGSVIRQTGLGWISGFAASIPLDSPDRDALALASILRWLGAEYRAGRIQPKGETT